MHASIYTITVSARTGKIVLLIPQQMPRQRWAGCSHVLVIIIKFGIQVKTPACIKACQDREAL